MAYTNPTITEFKDRFDRDFPFGTTLQQVRDADITLAYTYADVNLNEDLFTDQSNYSLAYLLLSAHYLVLNLRASSQGIAGQFSFLASSKGVGSVSEGIAIPEEISKRPEYSAFCKTTYGAQYLMFLLPQLKGNVFIAYGRTLP